MKRKLALLLGISAMALTALAGCGDNETVPTAPCEAPSAQCGAACVDTRSNPQHCGACDAACDPGEFCTNGTCGVICTGQNPTACGGTCVDPNTDRRHCGACDNACADGQVCSGGTCGLSCGGETPTLCGNGCVDTDSNPQHCGACGNACAAGEVCSEGACGLSCGGATATRCGNACVDAAVDARHCGACDNACAPGEVCSGGVCGLSCGGATPTQCGTACVDTGNNPHHCGACNSPCAAGETCTAGVCELACGGATPTRCGSACVDTAVNPQHCGACGNVCAAGEACVQGACEASCGSGLLVCGGACVNPDNDPNNCGACGTVCTAPANQLVACFDGTCGPGPCAGGFLDCDGNQPNGCEIDGSTNLDHCGACGNVCPPVANATPACSGGTCGVGACNMGFGDCDMDPSNGCEANFESSPAHCGACGNVCSGSTPYCLNGGCTAISFTSHTFTTCGVPSGRDGPSLSQCQAAYANEPFAQDPNLFSVSNGIQLWTVPVTGNYRIEARGAGSLHRPDQVGAIVAGTVALLQGDQLKILVGQISTLVDHGSGGSFVATMNDTPLFVAGGSGGISSELGSHTVARGVTTQLASANLCGGANTVAGAGGVCAGCCGGGGAGFTGNENPGGDQPAQAFINGGRGSGQTGLANTGGFGGGAVDRCEVGDRAGGGGGYSGGNAGCTNGGVAYASGGGSFITPLATAVATSNGQYEGSSTFAGQAIVNLGQYHPGNGQVVITRLP